MAQFRSARAQPDELPELMDEPDCDPVELSDALDVLARASRHFGGDRLLRRHVGRLLAGRTPGRLSVLDVGAGGGDIVLSLHRGLSRRGWTPRYTMADLHGVTLQLCRTRVRSRSPDLGRASGYVQLDGSRLPFRDASFDVVISTTTMHHLDDDAAGRLLAEFGRVARLGWVVTDLRRSPISLAAVRLLAATVWRRHRFPRADGPVSVRRSFTAREVRQLAHTVGHDAAVVEPHLMRWAARAGAGPS